MKTMTLDCYGIEITVTVGNDLDPTSAVSGAITSNLHAEICDSDTIGNEVADTLESFILSLACEGFDIESLAFKRALESTVDAIVNNFD